MEIKLTDKIYNYVWFSSHPTEYKKESQVCRTRRPVGRIFYKSTNCYSYNSWSNYFEDIPGISYDALIRLEALGIKKTLQLYEEVLTPQCRNDF